ncbi:MAG: hypothetical protein KDN05_02875 [Verrucomicrobiae bacterium]|nr:hypothetical protein [Verrucomicrobiae bacterium]MCP5545928.1 hypothetical protein [Akkermansiaceae bacterium]
MRPDLTRLFAVLLAVFSAGPLLADDGSDSPPKPAKVVVIPIRDQIAPPELYILRRGVKQAIESKADTLVLDMETPGGRLDITFEMLKTLEKFPGKTVTYIDDEAISAGALISAGTDEIYFSPAGIIGAAAPVQSTGADIDKTMKAKIVSYLKARVRSISEGSPYRGDVISAMIDIDYELKIGEEVLKAKGELLSLTAKEAVKTYGDPPEPLLGEGIAENINDLVTLLHGSGPHEIIRLETTWSEELAQYLNAITPVLLGLGFLALFVEFKTPGFGIFGIAGILLMLVVFFGSSVAGLAGNEAILVFLLGVALVALEVFLFPGTLVAAITGVILMIGSLVWAMLDHWPHEPMQFDGDEVVGAFTNVLIGIALAVGAFLALLKFLPKGGPLGGLVLQTAVGGEPGAPRALHDRTNDATPVTLIGRTGRSATSLFPSGQVEIDGKRYEAKLPVGFAEAGREVRVTGVSEFGLIVEVLS